MSRPDVLHPGHLEVKEPADLVVARHARDHLLDELVAPDLLAEGLPLTRVFDRRIQAGTDSAGCARRDGVAPVVEAAHRDLETVAFVTDSIRLGHLDIAHEDRPHIAGADSQTILDRLGAQGLAAGLAVEHERRDATIAGFRIRLREHEQEVRGVSVGDPDLLPVEHVAIATTLGGRLHRGHV